MKYHQGSIAIHLTDVAQDSCDLYLTWKYLHHCKGRTKMFFRHREFVS